MAKQPNRPRATALTAQQEALEVAKVSEPEPQAPARELPASGKQAARQYINDGSNKIDHDLFKLKVAKMTKNIGLPGQKSNIVQLEHCHVFHTVDSNGKPQTVTTAVGGHFHPVKVKMGENGVPVLEIGGPRKWVKKMVNGSSRRVMAKVIVEKEYNVEEGADLDEESVAQPRYDEHTHEYAYLGSQKIEPRKGNVEFAQFEAAIKSHQAPQVEGVKG